MGRAPIHHPDPPLHQERGFDRRSLEGPGPFDAGSPAGLEFLHYFHEAYYVAKRKPLPLPELSADIRKLFEVLNEEADLAAALIAGSYLDECLGSMLHRFLVRSKTAESLLSSTTGALGSFSVRIDLVYALGLINRFAFKDLKTLCEIRNAFAHSHLTLDFSSPVIQKLTSELDYLAVLDEEMNLNNASVGGQMALTSTISCMRAPNSAQRWGE